LPAYAAALTTTIPSLVFAINHEGQLALLLLLFAGAAVCLSVWEREPRALAFGALYGFLAVFAGRRYLELDYAVVPLLISAISYAVFAIAAALQRVRGWGATLLAVSFAYSVLAPLSGAYLIAHLADDEWYIGTTYFLESNIYQATVLSLAFLGGMIAALALIRGIGLAAALASLFLMAALLLEIAHFQPDNYQAFSAPLGLYLFVLALFATRYGPRLPEELSPWLERFYVLGPTLIMAPNFLQSLEQGAWHYGLLLLVESLVFLALALAQRRVWLLTIASAFVVANGLHYLFFEQTLPTWATLSLAGVLLMAAGTAILSARDRWPAIQDAFLSWWQSPSRQKAGRV
jgi:hypothetical protein